METVVQVRLTDLDLDQATPNQLTIALHKLSLLIVVHFSLQPFSPSNNKINMRLGHGYFVKLTS